MTRDVVRIHSRHKVAVVHSRHRCGVNRRGCGHRCGSINRRGVNRRRGMKVGTLAFPKSREKPSPYIFPHGLHSTLRVESILYFPRVEYGPRHVSGNMTLLVRVRESILVVEAREPILAVRTWESTLAV